MDMEGVRRERGVGGEGAGRKRELGRNRLPRISTKINTAVKPNSPQS